MAFPEKIDRVIFRASRFLTLKMTVRLLNQNREGKADPFFDDFEFNHKRYMKLNVNAFVTLEIPRQKDEEWSKDKSVSISSTTIYSVISAFNRIRQAFYETDPKKQIFALNQQNEVIIYDKMATDYQETINHLGNNQFMLIKPAVVYVDETTYEGVRIFINNTSNAVDLTIDQFEALLYHITQINMFEYAQSLVNFFIAYEGKTQEPTKRKTSTFTHKPVTQAPDEVKSNLRQDPKKFFNM